ncbi:MAG: hypothetical protein GF329_05540 [Candidatus Lokiarchaeota archaeon]|nr:hypothetical protein [Candidatus Lokiarchaeota archaeon]
MKQFKNIIKIFLVGVMFYLFMESFYNLMVNVNAYVFMNLSDLLSILPILGTTIILIVLLVLSFNTKRLIKHQYRLFLVIITISILRLIAQFIPSTSILLLLNFLILFSGMIFFNEIIMLIQNKQDFLNVNLLIVGVIFGLGLQYFFFIINISSNITTAFVKMIPLIIIIIIINVINFKEFLPENLKSLSQKVEGEINKKEISYIHFIVLGILFLACIIWIINPMALSAYGIINLNFQSTELLFPWFSYGYTYYIIIILLSGFIAYFLSQFLLTLNKEKIKLVFLSMVGLFILINSLSLIFLQGNRSILKTIFFTIATILNVSFIVYYALYLFNSYSFDSRPKLLIGLIIFFITILFFIIIQVQVLWYEYVSLLINVIILVGIGGVLICLLEIKNFSKLIKRKDFDIKIHRKTVEYLFFGIFLINGVTLGIISNQRDPLPPGSENPTFMTWNIHNAIGVDDSFDLDRLVEQIKVQDPDVLGLNEVDMGALKTSFTDIGTYFAHKLKMYYYYGYSFYKHYGNVLLSKYPILKAEIIKLPLIILSAEPRSMIKATLEINSSLWTVYVTHLSTESQDRLAQVPFIIEKINQSSFENVVWMGDFNFEPTDIEYGLINSTIPSLNFTDTYPYLNGDPGYTGHFDDDFIPQKRIDYIMTSPDLIPSSSEVWCSKASDHCAVITKF